MNKFKEITITLKDLITKWEPILASLDTITINEKRNNQKRNIKQILGHMIDSASNNTHRLIHFHYQSNPITFPDYANKGNNDKWIKIQNFENESWDVLVPLWKYIHLHLCHVIENIDESKLENIWISDLFKRISMAEMITDFPNHFLLHIAEIQELIDA